MANVAMERLESVIRFSKSTLQLVTLVGWAIAILLSVRTAANRNAGFGLEQNN